MLQSKYKSLLPTFASMFSRIYPCIYADLPLPIFWDGQRAFSEIHASNPMTLFWEEWLVFVSKL